MAIEVSSGVLCSKCGTAYGRRKGYFLVSYSPLNKGIGYMSVCKDCVNAMFSEYADQCDNKKLAMRQLCRKLDLYWNEKIYESVERKNVGQAIAVAYISRLTSSNYAGKCYDDTLKAENALWDVSINASSLLSTPIVPMDEELICDSISQESKSYWGLGFSNDQYAWLDQRKTYYEQKFPGIFAGEVAIGNDILIRQLCIQEVSNMQDIANGKSTSQGISTLNNIIGSLNLKPSQNAETAESALLKQPLGVLAKKIEERHPIKHNSERENELVRYVLIWFYGHMAKSQGISNIYSKMYEEEMARLRVERPDLNGIEDDDDFLSAVYDMPQDDGDT